MISTGNLATKGAAWWRLNELKGCSVYGRVELGRRLKQEFRNVPWMGRTSEAAEGIFMMKRNDGRKEVAV